MDKVHDCLYIRGPAYGRQWPIRSSAVDEEQLPVDKRTR